MKVKVADLKKVWRAFDFMQFPRMVGDPIQTAVYNEDEFVKWFASNTGKAICFTSHNSYPMVNRMYNPPSVEEVRVSNLFIDFDDSEKQENAQLDTIKIIKFCQEEGLPYLNQFSGSKGFHHFIRLEPSIHPYEEELKVKTRAIQNWLKDKLELRTMDDKCKEPRRLCRIPYSKYAKMTGHRKYIIGDTYCLPMSSDDISDLSFYEIRERSKNPTLYIPEVDEGSVDIDGFIDLFQIDIEEYSADKTLIDGERLAPIREYMKDWEEIGEDDFIQLVKELIPRMCVHNNLLSRNPTHAARRMTVIQLLQIGYSFSEVVSLFEQMAEKFKWVDRIFRTRRIGQIKHIYFHLPRYRHDKCGKIKNEHAICVGAICPYYRDW